MNEPPRFSDALIKAALSRRAAGPHTPAELIVDVRAALETIPQGLGWRWRLAPEWRLLPVVVVTLLLLAAAIGYALVLAGSVAPPSSESGEIAFVRATYGWGNRGITVGDRWIYSTEVDTGRPLLLAEVPGVEVPLVEGQLVRGFGRSGPAPEWSPDGQRIAFRVFNDGAGLYVMNRDGTDLSQLVDLPRDDMTDWYRESNAMASGLAWSPDGSQIALTYPFFGVHSPLFVVDAVTGEMRRVTGEDRIGGADGSVAWSPDGSELAFARRAGNGVESSLIVVNADGTGERRVDQPGDDESLIGGIAWSPTTGMIAFVRTSIDPAAGNGVSLAIANSDGSGEHQLAHPADGACCYWRRPTPAAWSPDASRIAYVLGGIRIAEADGSGDTLLTYGESPSWSPEGSHLVFSRPGTPIPGAPDGVAREHAIYVINADGTGLRWLADGEYPVWSSPGSGE